MKRLSERQRHTLAAIIRGAQLRRANREDDLMRQIFGTLGPNDRLFHDIQELSLGCSQAMLAADDSEELESWNDLWNRTVRACRRRVC